MKSPKFKKIVKCFLKTYDVGIKKKKASISPRKIGKKIFLQIAMQGMKAQGVNTIAEKIEGDQRFISWDPKNFLNGKGDGLLLKYLGHKRKCKKIMEHYGYISSSSPAKWIRDINSGKISLGMKSDDDFLKDLGFFNRIPIDRFYPPFLMRTGLLFEFILNNNIDPAVFVGNLSEKTTYKAYTELLTQLCFNSLKGLEYKDTNLADNPGVIDFFVWRHCASSEPAINICGRTPKCDQCCIHKYCDYGSVVMQK